ncbi:hypothetical protein EFK50_03625 [Nocardioides marmoriginsengisoli]|uniref:Cholesterol esterase n=2 Tax=Nocardioides marmoriginsengisoli TaxID=661483 RepID=A0A3N0CPX0_9ACTN|nr:hypothetical protein EFK50_03625 [Nocardioides marmoriginsengisoli]
MRRRFLAVTAPSFAACAAIGAAIVLGYLTVSLAAARPIEISSSHGAADSLALVMSTDRAITGLDMGSVRPQALVHLTGAEFDDLCLVPRLELPIIGGLASIRLHTGDAVGLRDVTLSAAQTRAGVDLPATVIGAAAGDQGLTPGGFMIETARTRGGVDLERVEMQAYGLVLADGITLRSLKVRPALGDQHC